MARCDLCRSASIARVALLRGRSEDRLWLCQACCNRLEEHELDPTELLALVRLTARRRGRCNWCAERPPATQARVPADDGRVFAFDLCAECARKANEQGASILTGQAAIAGDTTVDDRYERALEIDRRRRQIRRVK